MATFKLPSINDILGGAQKAAGSILPSIEHYATNTAQNIGNAVDNEAHALPGQALNLAEHNPVTNYFNPSVSGRNGFWSPTNPISNTLSGNFQLPRFNLESFSNNIHNPIGRTGAQLGLGIADSLLNTPQDIIQAPINVARDINTHQTAPRQILGDVAPFAEGMFNIGTLGGGAVIKDLAEQGGKMAFKQALKEGAIQGGKYGALYGGLGGLESGRNIKDPVQYAINLVSSTLTGAATGGALGGATSGIGSVIGKFSQLLTPKKLDTQLRDLQGRYVAGETPVKPKGMTKDQWEFQLNFNSKYKRNPYTPVYNSDLLNAAKYESGRMGAGLSVRDVNKDVNPLGAEVKNPLKNTANSQPAEGRDYDKQIAYAQKYKTYKDFINSLNSGGAEVSTVNPAKNRIIQNINKDYGSLENFWRIANGKDPKVRSSDLGLNSQPFLKPQLPTQINNSSKAMINKDTLYHGSARPGETVSAGDGNLGKGVYLTNNAGEARSYAAGFAGGVDPSSYLDVAPQQIKKVQLLTDNLFKTDKMSLSPQEINSIKSKGFDGIQTPHETVVFDQNKVKVTGHPTPEEFANTEPVGITPQTNKKIKLSGMKKNPQVGGFTNTTNDMIASKYRASEPLPWEANNQVRVMGRNGESAMMQKQLPQSQGLSQENATSPYQNTLDKSLSQPIQQEQKVLQNKVEPLQNTSKMEEQAKTPLQKLETARMQAEQGTRSNQSYPSISDIVDNSGFDVKKKINVFDNWLRTPDRVLQKIGLGKEAEQLRGAYDNYLKELPQEIDKVTQWSKQVPSEENQALFKYLDGQTKKNTLSPQAQKVAEEIKTYLNGWADKLGLSKDQRVTNYITHIFDKQNFTKEIDPDLAKIIRDKVAGSVYDPFTEKRLGALGYKEDTWAALDAYVKRATRKVNMDPILNIVSQKADNLEESQFDYVKKYVARINMQPTKLDNLLDNTIKQVVGYKFGSRPTTYLTKTMRQLGFRGSLGLNVGSALRNLTQGINTYSKLGEKYTTIGYYNLAKSIASGSKELEEQGILRNDFIQDRTVSATKQFTQKMDKGLFALFEAAEKINRGSAYFGAKAKAIAEGKSEPQAIEYAKKLVRDTQFSFGQIDSPGVLSSDLGKTLGQFQSFNIKQGEFLTEMAKNKEFKGLARYIVGNLVVASTIGTLFGMKPTDMIPGYGIWSGQTKLGQTPSINAAEQVINAVNPGAKDQYGNPLTPSDRVGNVINAAIPLIPAGVQAKKTLQGLQTVGQGYSTSKGGKIQTPVKQTPSNYIRGALFGKNYLPEQQQYYNSNSTPLSDSQSAFIKQSTNPMSDYNTILNARKQAAATNQLKDNIKGSGQSQTVGNQIIYNNNGKVETIDLSPPTKGQGIDAFTNQDWQYSRARDVFKAQASGGITQQQANAAYKKLGVDSQDVRYDYIATHNNDVKTQYLISKSPDHTTLLNNIITGRVVSVSGTQFAADGVLTNLYNQGLISKAEETALKKMKLDKKGNQIGRVSGSGKKPSLSGLPTFKLTLPNSGTKQSSLPTFGEDMLKKIRLSDIKPITAPRLKSAQ